MGRGATRRHFKTRAVPLVEALIQIENPSGFSEKNSVHGRTTNTASLLAASAIERLFSCPDGTWFLLFFCANKSGAIST